MTLLPASREKRIRLLLGLSCLVAIKAVVIAAVMNAASGGNLAGQVTAGDNADCTFMGTEIASKIVSGRVGSLGGVSLNFKMKNVGSSAWTPGAYTVQLRSQQEPGWNLDIPLSTRVVQVNGAWTSYSTGVNDPVNPGQSAVFDTGLAAPPSPLTTCVNNGPRFKCNVSVSIAKNGQPFGGNCSAAYIVETDQKPMAGSYTFEDAEIDAYGHPLLEPGKTYKVHFRVKNQSASTWKKNQYRILLNHFDHLFKKAAAVFGTVMFKQAGVQLYTIFPANVAPGETLDLTVPFTVTAATRTPPGDECIQREPLSMLCHFTPDIDSNGEGLPLSWPNQFPVEYRLGTLLEMKTKDGATVPDRRVTVQMVPKFIDVLPPVHGPAVYPNRETEFPVEMKVAAREGAPEAFDLDMSFDPRLLTFDAARSPSTCRLTSPSLNILRCRVEGLRPGATHSIPVMFTTSTELCADVPKGYFGQVFTVRWVADGQEVSWWGHPVTDNAPSYIFFDCAKPPAPPVVETSQSVSMIGTRVVRTVKVSANAGLMPIINVPDPTGGIILSSTRDSRCPQGGLPYCTVTVETNKPVSLTYTYQFPLACDGPVTFPAVTLDGTGAAHRQSQTLRLPCENGRLRPAVVVTEPAPVPAPATATPVPVAEPVVVPQSIPQILPAAPAEPLPVTTVPVLPSVPVQVPAGEDTVPFSHPEPEAVPVLVPETHPASPAEPVAPCDPSLAPPGIQPAAESPALNLLEVLQSLVSPSAAPEEAAPQSAPEAVPVHTAAPVPAPQASEQVSVPFPSQQPLYFVAPRPEDCTDTDVMDDPYKKGFVTAIYGGSPVRNADECQGANRVRQYKCSGASITSWTGQCPGESLCSSGACVRPVAAPAQQAAPAQRSGGWFPWFR